MYKIIFFDIDGTLRDEALGIPKTAKDAIRLCKENGCYVCLCTGRTIGTIPDDVLGLDVDGIIAGGGSHIEFHNKIIKNKFFSEEMMDKVHSYLKDSKENTGFTFETNDIIFMNKEAVNILTLANEIKFNLLTEEDKKLTEASQKIIYEENVHDFDKNLDKTNKICLWSEEDVFIKIRDVFLEGKSQLAQSFPFESRYYYEIIQSKCNKGEAILELCHDLHIPIEETMAFGDGLNDIDMLKVVGTAIGIESGNKEIFKYVSSICEEPMKDGIYLELKRRNVI